MADPGRDSRQECLLVYDGRCRFCVAAKKGLEKLETEPASHKVRMITYESEEAKRLLGKLYRTGRPDAAYLIGPSGEVTRGFDAFVPLLPGLRGGRILSVLFRFALARRCGAILYRVIARYRYRLFGSLPSEHFPQ